MTTASVTTSRSVRNSWANAGVWTLQALLAALFVFAGSMKFVMTVEQMALPGWFLHFIGACEILGGIGLILPLALRIRPGLTPLAATLLVPIMVGATVISIMTGGVGAGAVPFFVGAVCAFIAYYRSKSLRRSARSTFAQTAA